MPTEPLSQSLHLLKQIQTPELQDAYAWVCSQTGTVPSSELIGTDGKAEPDFHAIGNAFFRVWEEKLGTGIYRDFMHGEFDYAAHPANRLS